MDEDHITYDGNIPVRVINHFKNILRFSIPKDKDFMSYWHMNKLYVFYKTQNIDHGRITTYTEYQALCTNTQIPDSFDYIEASRPSLSAQHSMTIGSYNKKIKRL